MIRKQKFLSNFSKKIQNRIHYAIHGQTIEKIEKELDEQGVWRNHNTKKTTAEGELSFCFGVAPGIRKKGRKPNAFLYEVEMKKGRENISTDEHSIARYKVEDV